MQRVNILFVPAFFTIALLFSCQSSPPAGEGVEIPEAPPPFAALVEWGGGTQSLEWEGRVFVEEGILERAEPYGFDEYGDPPDLFDWEDLSFRTVTLGWKVGLRLWGRGYDDARIVVQTTLGTFPLSLGELRSQGEVFFQTEDGKGEVSFQESGLRGCEVILPSVANVGEPFRVELKLVDALGYPIAESCTVELHSLDGTLEGLPPLVDFEPWHEGRITLERIKALEESIFRVQASSEAFAGISLSNPMACEGQAGLRIFWGDLRGHSELSEGRGTPEEYFFYGRNVGVLDLCVLTDHSDFPQPLNQEDWRRISQSADRFCEPGRFVTFLGFEWSSDARGLNKEKAYGHRGVYFREGTWKDKRPFPAATESPDLCQTPEDLFEKIRPLGDGAMTIPFHCAYPVSAYSSGMDWAFYDLSLDRLVEIYSKHGTSEYLGNPSPLGEMDESKTVREALALGYRMGFCAGGDDKNGEPGTNTKCFLPYSRTGLTAVCAEVLTREGVWKALQQRHCYATDGARILVRFFCGKAMMGDEVELSSPPEFEVQVAGTAPLEKVEIVRYLNGFSTVYERKGEGYAASFQWRDDSWKKGGGLCFYYLRVTQEDGHRAWASPVWVGESKSGQGGKGR